MGRSIPKRRALVKKKKKEISLRQMLREFKSGAENAAKHTVNLIDMGLSVVDSMAELRASLDGHSDALERTAGLGKNNPHNRSKATVIDIQPNDERRKSESNPIS